MTLLCVIYKFFNVVYIKTTYEDTIFVGENLWINIEVFIYLHKLLFW